jgi:multidrug efflux system membrane fusion protein
MKTLSLIAWILLAVVLVAAAGAGIYYFENSPAAKMAGAPGAPGGPGGARPPTPVTVQTMAEQKVRLWTSFSGRMTAIDYAQIKPEVNGRIVKVEFQDGQSVKAGDEIFLIDPAPYEAAVARAQAAVATAQSKVEFSKTDQARVSGLVEQHAMAQSDLDNSNNVQRQATAELASAEAVLQQANVDLDRAHVKAPISGRMSRAEVTVGNVVQSGVGAPVLTTIVSQDGIYADFEVDEQTYLQTVRNSAKGNAQESRIPVQLIVQGDTDHTYNGFIQSFDNQIIATSATIRARARFDNRDGALLPGMFVTVKLASSQDRDALLVPDRAIGFDQDKKFVYVVDGDNKVSYREVQLGKSVQSQRVVESGLKEGDRVVVDGTQFVRPNDTVAPTEVAETGPLGETSGDEQVAKSNRP